MINLSRPRKAKPAARPRRGVAAHRLFPLAAALWCGALLALCCLAAGTQALGALSLTLHLPAIVPAAAPPLGSTARALLVALAGLGGTVAGMVIGWRLHARAIGPVVRRQPKGRDDDADDAVEAEPVVAEVPIRAGAPRVRSRDAHPDAPPRRPLVVTEDVLPFAATSRFVTPAPEAAEPVIEPAPHAADPAEDLPPFLAEAWHASRAEAPEPEVVREPAVVSEPVAVAPAPAPEPVFVIPALPLAARAAAEPRLPIGDAPIESLGLVQLIERLAQAIAARQALRAERDAAAAEAASALAATLDPRAPLHRFDPLTMDPTGPLLRAKPRRDPAFEVELDPAEAAIEPAADVDPDSDDPLAGEHRYASLAAMAMPRPDLIAAAESSAEPAEAPAASPVVQLHPRGSAVPVADAVAEEQGEDPDRALRDALATLRRISGQR